MKKALFGLLISGFGLGVLTSTAASAQSVTVVHGIDGRDLGQAQALPVDISINGSCALQGVSYRGISPALTVAAEVYNVEVRVSNGSCTGTLAATARFDLGLGENASVIAHLNEQGAPVVTKFTNDLRSPAGGRVMIRHTASAPDVFVTLLRRKTSALTGVITNGKQTQLDAPAGSYRATIRAAGSGARVAQANVPVQNETLLVVYAVGSVKGESFSLITQSFPLAQ